MRSAIVTMVWNDDFFLRVWREYYAQQVGASNLFVFNHGAAPSVHEICHDLNVIDLPREAGDLDFDAKRWRLLSGFVQGLTGYYDTVICVDVDELVVPTTQNASLPDVLDALPGQVTYCAPGFELFPENDAYSGASLGANCAGALFSPFYSKSCITKTQVEFFPGAHGLIGAKPVIVPDLALLHLKLLNTAENARRNADRVAFANAAYDASDRDKDDILSAERYLATWLNAPARSRQEKRKFRKADPLRWDDALSASLAQLAKLRVQEGNVHRFRRHPKTQLRAPLPGWIKALF